ncbi:hypothetical protein IscW_ISCW023776 [Ixodes scapularis]|uniref:Uncharacterized protein n=1 Tax=Ixodes scapularis TaxID=6945 RepID=B7QMC7_IXOSC|nr:hypothetical protein IscW_ISCW023776 [Ixodes scapularis]|eukprot:XP_002416332.1 hypothetical protein IscW_ISCW023776 [Ixodes scapularis]
MHKCYVPAEFKRCDAEDIKRQWWFLRDGDCRRWGFPNSNCVLPGLAFFRNAEDCRNMCVIGTVTERHPACRDMPVEHVCTPMDMHYSVYAVLKGNNR